MSVVFDEYELFDIRAQPVKSLVKIASRKAVRTVRIFARNDKAEDGGRRDVVPEVLSRHHRVRISQNGIRFEAKSCTHTEASKRARVFEIITQ